VSGQHSAPDSESEYDDLIEELLEEVTHVDEQNGGSVAASRRCSTWGKLSVTEETYENIRYRLNRDIVGLGPLEPVMRDSANEDIHVIGPKECHVDHGTYGMLETTVDFGTPKEFDNWLRNMGERIGDPLRLRPHRRLYAPGRVAYQHHLLRRRAAEGLLAHDPAGRGGAAVDQPDHQLGTLSPELSAYLWLCLENEQTVFVVGETASGKTTTLNAILSYIPSDSKIYRGRHRRGHPAAQHLAAATDP